MRISTAVFAAATLVAACAEPTAPTASIPTDDAAPLRTIAPGSGERVLLDLRSSLQGAQSMREALALFGVSADSRANFGFATDADGAGTRALRVDWPSAGGACTGVSPSLGYTFAAPAPRALAISWRQRLGRTATGGGIGEVDAFDVVRPECGSAGRFVLFVNRSGTSNRVELKWGGADPGSASVRSKKSMAKPVTANQGWRWSPQEHVGEVIEQTLYIRSESAPGAGDGVLRLWVNDAKLIDTTGAFVGAEGMDKLILPWTSPAPARDQSEYLWDLVAWVPSADLVGPGEPPPPPPPDTAAAPVATVSISPASASLEAGRTAQLTATARDSTGAVVGGRSASWSSSNPDVATVSPSGLASAVAAGSATITATIDGRSGSATITVTAPPPPDTAAAPVATVSVSPSSAALEVKGTVQLTATARDSTGAVVGGRSTTWSSSDATVATVSSGGLVTATGAGTAMILATVEGKSGSATITVTEPTPPPGTHTGWYVSPGGRSSNAGTAASPWDLATALDGAGGRVQPGDTIWLRGGTYPDGGELTVGGTATAPVVVSGYPGETAVIQRQFAGTASYVVITRLVFEGPIDGATNQVYLHGNHHVVFTRNEIRFGDFHAGLSVDESHHYTITHNYIHDNGRDASHDHGIYFKTTTGPGTVIAHNLLVGNAARGLSLHDNSGVGVFDVVVAHNTVVGNGSTGILVNDGDRNTLVNNVVVGNGDATGQAQIRVLAGDANRVWSNLTWHATASGRRGIENTTGSAVSGNVVADPRFRSATDLRLQTGSPAIDAGLTGWTIDGTDYSGKARDAKPDLGAYEQ